MDVSLEFLQERYDLSIEKIREIAAEGCGDSAVSSYFSKVAEFICLVDAYYKFALQDGMQTASEETLKEWNHKLYEDILPENYDRSFADPAYAVRKLGEKYGRFLSALYAEMRSMIVIVREGCQKECAEYRRETAEDSGDENSCREDCLEELLIKMELFVEVCSTFVYEWQEKQEYPSYESIRQIFYWYVSDYTDITYEWELKRKRKRSVSVNLQYDHDHKEDMALVWDKALLQRKLEVMRTVLEKHKGHNCICYDHGAPESDEKRSENSDVKSAAEFEDKNAGDSTEVSVVDKPQALRLTAEQQKLLREYHSQTVVMKELLRRNSTEICS